MYSYPYGFVQPQEGSSFQQQYPPHQQQYPPYQQDATSSYYDVQQYSQSRETYEQQGYDQQQAAAWGQATSSTGYSVAMSVAHPDYFSHLHDITSSMLKGAESLPLIDAVNSCKFEPIHQDPTQLLQSQHSQLQMQTAQPLEAQEPQTYLHSSSHSQLQPQPQAREPQTQLLEPQQPEQPAPAKQPKQPKKASVVKNSEQQTEEEQTDELKQPKAKLAVKKPKQTKVAKDQPRSSVQLRKEITPAEPAPVYELKDASLTIKLKNRLKRINDQSKIYNDNWKVALKSSEDLPASRQSMESSLCECKNTLSQFDTILQDIQANFDDHPIVAELGIHIMNLRQYLEQYQF